ncbi:trimethylamine methyltransferase family protein [Eubacterium sp.]|uniref:trimethylamine methyltransferase family protein n=1 Tax=Eubacterium sp. TaxID=142586 RepID=UPI0026E0C1B3|nr:trimethylamine methyltransferase family protein [Eubacterium sp.]MDO5431454.1 trimethylamine methyltransferase family protein [Eubacterium sp.]
MKNYENYISKSEIEKIHEYTLRILSEIGIKFEHEGALSLFKKHGARVENETVFIPESLLNEVLKYAKKQFTIKSCKGNLEIGSGQQYGVPILGNVYRHHNHGGIKKMTNQDVIDQFKLSDTSDITKVSTMNYFLSYDDSYSENQKVFGNVAMVLKYSQKPMLMSAPNTFIIDSKEKGSEAYRKSLELVNRFEGTEGTHSAYVVNTLSPLTLDHDPIERIFILAETQQAMIITPCAMPLMTAPPSLASMIAMTNAEILAGYTLAKLVNPDANIVYGNTSAATDMRTIQLAIGSPECSLVIYAVAGLADLYGLPFRTGGSLSDAKELDVQAGAESMMNILTTRNAGADIVFHTCGCMGSFNVSDFEKFLVDEEIHHMACRMTEGINCNDENFCFDLLKKTGPRGVFLKGRTPKMYREEVYLPKYFNKDDPNQWQNKGSISVNDRVEDEVKKRLESFVPADITKEQAEILNPYIHEKYRDML